MTKRPENKTFTHISDVLSHLIRNVRRESDSELSRIRDVWERVLDPVLAENTRPAALKSDQLLVHVASSTVTQQLRFMNQDIIEQVNRVLGGNRIRQIKYKIGPVHSAKKE